MTDKEILELDFYDLFGSAQSFATDEEKIAYYRKAMGEDKRTAVEMLYDKIQFGNRLTSEELSNLFAQAIKIEKEQHNETFNAGFNYEGGHPIDEFEEYYTETYGQ